MRISIRAGRDYVRYAPTEADTCGGISGGMPRKGMLKILLFSKDCVLDGNDTLQEMQIGSEEKQKAREINVSRAFLHPKGPRWSVAIRSGQGYFWGMSTDPQH